MNPRTAFALGALTAFTVIAFAGAYAARELLDYLVGGN